MRWEHRHFVLCLALVASPVPATDYALGLAAYHRGDIAVAHREFSALAEQGDPAAQYSLAMLYLKGDQPDYARAIPWLQKSAGSGLPDSQYMLGMLSLYGVGMAKDAERGMLLLEQASEQGNEHAQALLGQLETARIREAESQRHKAQQARNLGAELDKAKASEQELQKRLARSRKREKSLASERASLNQARVSDSAAKDKMRQEQARLEAELESLRLQLAEAERVRGHRTRSSWQRRPKPNRWWKTHRVKPWLPARSSRSFPTGFCSPVSRVAPGGAARLSRKASWCSSISAPPTVSLRARRWPMPRSLQLPTVTSTKAALPAVSALIGPSETNHAVDRIGA
jgi:hypothetical protein